MKEIQVVKRPWLFKIFQPLLVRWFLSSPIFSKIQISEMYRANLSLVTGRLVRRSTRTYLKPGTGNQNSWMHGYKISLHHSPEVYVLSGYAIGLMIVMAWT